MIHKTEIGMRSECNDPPSFFTTVTIHSPMQSFTLTPSLTHHILEIWRPTGEQTMIWQLSLLGKIFICAGLHSLTSPFISSMYLRGAVLESCGVSLHLFNS